MPDWYVCIIPGSVTVIFLIPLNPWSTLVLITWLDAVDDCISAISNPSLKSLIDFSTVSLVILNLGSLTTTSPIGSGKATEKDFEGFALGVSLLNCGYKFCIGCAKERSLNGATVGLFDELITVKWYIPSCWFFLYGCISSDRNTW